MTKFHACLFAVVAGFGTVYAEILKNTFEQMPYQLSSPKVAAGNLYPLVVCLHGAAGRGTDNAARGIEAYAVLNDSAVQAKHPAFLLAPQCNTGFQWVDAPWAKGSYNLDQVPESVYMKKVHALILQVMKDYPVDPARIYVTGQSMGGFGTWNLILNHPELFAAAIPICGGGSPAHAERIKNTPIQCFHGAKDTTVPTDASRDMAVALEKAGSSVFKYTELPNGTHVIMKEVWATPGLIDWLFEQKK